MTFIPLLALLAVFAIMGLEFEVSLRNERRLRSQGAVEPAHDVYPWLRVVYPACFIAMAVEGWLRGGPPAWAAAAGVIVLAAAKALKTWVIASLGPDWSFHVLVRPAHRMVTKGPYRYLRHPNYLAIVAEIAGMAMVAAAPVTGLISLAAMGFLLRKRIAVEERALGLRA